MRMRTLFTAFLVATSLIATACTSNQQTSLPISSKDDGGATETDKTQRYEFSLTKDNLWYFIDSEYSVTNGNYYSCIYTFAGVLSYAYYENVVIHLDYDIVGMGEPGSYMYPTTTHKADIEFKLNASGSGLLTLPYDYVPSNAVPAITQTDLYGFTRTLTIKSVSGIVRFSI